MTFAGGDEARKTADAVARRSYGKLVAFLAAHTRDVAAAEDALAEAFASALVDWPANGCPKNPEGWLLTVARRKLIDSVRRRQTGEAASTQLQILAEGLEDAAAQAERDMQIPDKRLALLFACAHPAIEVGIRAPLMLQVVLGLDGETIASAFLVSPAAMRKRLSRAKEKIQQAGIPFSIPEREELPHRLDTVLDAIYASFAEGWTDASGTDAIRRDLTDEAIFLARLVVELLPQEAEALGLLALMLHAEARRPARRNAAGDYVPLAEQDPQMWNSQMIDEAEACCVMRSCSRRSGAINSKPRSSRRMPIAAALVRTIGRKLCTFTMRSPQSPIHPSSRSIERSRSRSCMDRKLRPKRSRTSQAMIDSANTSRIGPRALRCYRRAARTTKRVRHTNGNRPRARPHSAGVSAETSGRAAPHLSELALPASRALGLKFSHGLIRLSGTRQASP